VTAHQRRRAVVGRECGIGRRAVAGRLLVVLVVLAGVISGGDLAAAPSTRAVAAHITTSGRVSGDDAVTTADDIDTGGEVDRPPLSYSQALRLIRTVAPGLVDITATLAGGDGKAGTGIVITSNGGVVVTNFHVISGAVTLIVHDLGNDLDYTAAVVGVDRAHDIAVLALDGASGLHTARLGATVALGDIVAAVGNAHGFGSASLGAGPVVAMGRSIASTTGQTRPLTGLIEARNGVEPGESGGPLVSIDGRVVGVTVAMELSADGTPDGFGFAIPVAAAMGAVRRILAQAGGVEQPGRVGGPGACTARPSTHSEPARSGSGDTGPFGVAARSHPTGPDGTALRGATASDAKRRQAAGTCPPPRNPGPPPLTQITAEGM
jgi:S1-C subfamily serine protease